MSESTPLLQQGESEPSGDDILVSAGDHDGSRSPEILVSYGNAVDIPSISVFLSADTSGPAATSTPIPGAHFRFPLILPDSPPQSPPPICASQAARDVEAELRVTVDEFLYKKKESQRTLADENTALRSQVSFLKHALDNASSQPGSEMADILAALEHERTLRIAAEESRTATGRFLAEQVEAVSKQKIALERALRDYTHGREFWKARAIAALERCEALEEENMRVKTQLNALSRKQSSFNAPQINSVLREVAKERDRLKLLEEADPPLMRAGKRTNTWTPSDVVANRLASQRRLHNNHSTLVQ